MEPALVTLDSSLLQKQWLFSLLLAKLILFAYDNGYNVVGGEWQRKQAQADINAALGSGIKNSIHLKSLAVDLAVFLRGAYLKDSKDYAPLGEYWKSLHPLCRWGGDFKDAAGASKPDGDHFSIEHEGVK